MVNQIFTIKIMLEEYLGKREKLYTAFMDLAKAYNKVKEAHWNILKIYGVGGQLPGRI